MRGNKVFKVVVGIKMQSHAGQRKLSGIYKFLSGKYMWEITLLRSVEELSRDFINQTRRKTNGYLISLHEPKEIRQALVKTGKPIVFLDEIDVNSIIGNENASFLKTDQHAVGAMAANYFLGINRFASYGFVNAIGNIHWSVEREKGFTSALARKNITAHVYDSDSQKLSDWIKELPKPAAIFAAFDDRAVDVINVCNARKIKIPKDVMVLGAGNDELVCTSCRPTISSVNIPFDAHGFAAARELQAKMMLPIRKSRILRTPNEFTISQRQTTSDKTLVSALVHDGLAFISAFATSGIKVPDVINHLKVSRRLADLRFRQATRKSILQTITETQINEAKRLLLSTTLSISEIASRCGFSNANYFKNVFYRTVGESPRAWRNAQQT